MIKNLLLLVSVFVPLSLFAQKGELLNIENNVDFGTISKTNQPLRGIRYTFDTHIYRCFTDSSGIRAGLQLRNVGKNGEGFQNKGYVEYLDLANRKIVCSRKIDFQSIDVIQTNTWLLLKNLGETVSIDPLTGNGNWWKRKNIYYVGDHNDVALGYGTEPILTSLPQTLAGYDRQSGKELWKRKLDREFKWNDAFHIDDSTLMVVSSGLHTVNLYTGKGWDYNAVTGSKDYTKVAMANALGIGLTLLTGTGAIFFGHDVVSDLVSNVVSDSTHYYLASQDQLTCLDLSGHLLWFNSLPSDQTSQSFLFQKDSSLILINRGKAHFNERSIPFGAPFIASYSRQTGLNNFFTNIEKHKVEINDFHHVADTVFLITKNSIIKVSLKTGAILGKQDNLGADKEELFNFLPQHHFYIATNDSVFQSLAQMDSSLLPVYTSAGRVLMVSPQLQVVKVYDYVDLYFDHHWQQTNHLVVLGNDRGTVVIDKKGNQVAEIKGLQPFWTKGDILYGSNDNSLNIIDLKPLRQQSGATEQVTTVNDVAKITIIRLFTGSTRCVSCHTGNKPTNLSPSSRKRQSNC